jgi:hypothetical protein
VRLEKSQLCYRAEYEISARILDPTRHDDNKILLFCHKVQKLEKMFCCRLEKYMDSSNSCWPLVLFHDGWFQGCFVFITQISPSCWSEYTKLSRLSTQLIVNRPVALSCVIYPQFHLFQSVWDESFRLDCAVHKARHIYNGGRYCCQHPALTTVEYYDALSMAVKCTLNRHTSYIFALKCLIFMEIYCPKTVVSPEFFSGGVGWVQQIQLRTERTGIWGR